MSLKGMTLTVLATQLAEAVAKDEAHKRGGCDLSAGMYGPNVKQWLRDLADALCAPDPGDVKWQPIETAPKDGTRVLLFFPVFGIKPHQEFGQWVTQKHNKKPVPYWSGDCQSIYGMQWYRSFTPSHWKPLSPMPDNVGVDSQTRYSGAVESND